MDIAIDVNVTVLLSVTKYSRHIVCNEVIVQLNDVRIGFILLLDH